MEREIIYVPDSPPSATGTLGLLAYTQTSIDNFSDEIIRSVKEGESDPLAIYVILKAFEKSSDRILKETKENALTAADKYPGTAFEFMGNQFQKANTKVDYDYSVCNDAVYNRRLKLFEEAKKQVEERKEFLKAVKEPMTLVDEDSGEVSTIHPPKVSRTAGLKLTIK